MSVEDSRSPPQLTDYEKDLIKSLRAERRRKPGSSSQAAASAPPAPAAGASAAQSHRGPARSPAPASSRDPGEALRSPSPAAPSLNQPRENRAPSRAPSFAERVSDAHSQRPPEKSAKHIADAAPPSLESAPGAVAADHQQPAVASPHQGAHLPPTPASSGHPAAATTPRPATAASPYPVRSSRPRWIYLLLGAALVAVAAVVVIWTFKPAPTVKPLAPVAREESAKATPAPAQDTGNTPAPAEDTRVPVKDDAAQTLETMFASFAADRRKGRLDFRKALLSTAPASEARRRYLEVAVSGLRLRGAPSENAPVLAVVRRGAYVRLNEVAASGDWCGLRLPQGREGWTKCGFLKPIAELSAVPSVHGEGKETTRR